jgi:hypothetical protein
MMKTLPTTACACATLLFAGSVLAEQAIKPKDWFAFRKEAIGCINFDDAVEAERLIREAKGSEAAKFVERQHAMAIQGDHNRDCVVFDEHDGRKWPAWEVDFKSSRLTPGTFAICTSDPKSLAPRSPGAPCGFWVIVRMRDVIR